MEDMVRVMHRISECSYEEIPLPPMPYSEALQCLKKFRAEDPAGFADDDGPLFDLVYVENGRLASWRI